MPITITEVRYPASSLRTCGIRATRSAASLDGLRVAMGEEGCGPQKLRNPATAQFLNKFIELAGFEPTSEVGRSQKSYIENAARRASDLFEGEGMSADLETGKSLSPRRARRLWIETAKHFGYDTDNLK